MYGLFAGKSGNGGPGEGEGSKEKTVVGEAVSIRIGVVMTWKTCEGGETFEGLSSNHRMVMDVVCETGGGGRETFESCCQITSQSARWMVESLTDPRCLGYVL